MKRKFTLLLAAALCLSLAGCFGLTSGRKAPTASPAASGTLSSDYPSSDAPSSGEPTPEPTPEPIPTPEPTPEVVANFDTRSRKVDSDHGYDYYYVPFQGVVRFNPASGTEETVLVMPSSNALKSMCIWGGTTTYGALFDGPGEYAPPQALVEWSELENQTTHFTSVSAKVVENYEVRDYGVKLAGKRIGETEDYGGDLGDVGFRIGRAWWLLLSEGQYSELLQWMGKDDPQQGTEEAARWCYLLTDNYAIAQCLVSNVYDWPGAESGEGEWCVAAQTPNGENQRVLWVEEGETEPVLDAIIEDKLLYHTEDAEGAQHNWVYDLTTGEKRENYVVPMGEVVGFTPTAAYVGDYADGPARRELDYSTL